MKLLTLLTSLIITLASSNVFAQKFVCSNWFYEMRNGEEVEGTMFDGEKKDKNFFITDKHKMKRTLTYFATDGGFTYYISGNKDSSVKIFSIDFSEVDQIIEKLIPEIKKLNNIKGILFPVGLMHEKDEVNLSKESVEDIFYANFLSITLTIVELKKIITEKGILIVGFGSVSGLLGRNLNSNYAASKRALESYFESLVFDEKEKDFKIHFYTLGYLDTSLAFGKKLFLPKGRISSLANIVYKNRDKKIVKRYFPYFWGPIALIIKLAPLKILIKIKKILK